MQKPEDLREKIRQVMESIAKLNIEKEDLERSRGEGEEIMEKFNSLTKRLSDGIGNFEGNLKTCTRNFEGCFGEYYEIVDIGSYEEYLVL